jgi:hypothetical protein
MECAARWFALPIGTARWSATRGDGLADMVVKGSRTERTCGEHDARPFGIETRRALRQRNILYDYLLDAGTTKSVAMLGFHRTREYLPLPSPLLGIGLATVCLDRHGHFNVPKRMDEKGESRYKWKSHGGFSLIGLVNQRPKAVSLARMPLAKTLKALRRMPIIPLSS